MSTPSLDVQLYRRKTFFPASFRSHRPPWTAGHICSSVSLFINLLLNVPHRTPQREAVPSLLSIATCSDQFNPMDLTYQGIHICCGEVTKNQMESHQSLQPFLQLHKERQRCTTVYCYSSAHFQVISCHRATRRRMQTKQTRP